MEDIKVGEYVRVTNFENKTVIGKVTEVYENSYIVDTQQEETSGEYGKCCEFKHSTNIIDLIEVGDYVNGCRIDEITSWRVLVHKARGIDKSGFSIPVAQYDENIKSIVTHEQFKNASYEV